MSNQSITRRDFIKIGCSTVAAAGLTICGISQVFPNPDSSSINVPSLSFGEKNMNQKILIAYASGLGSTAEVAAEIGKTMGDNGFSVDVKPVGETPVIDGYHAALIGSAVRHGNWLPEAVEFVEANQGALNDIPVALFTMHITNLGNDPASRENRLAYLDQVRPLVQPVDEVFFSGKFDRRGAALLLPGWLARLVPTLDFRKWQNIRAWAKSVIPHLFQQG